MICVKEHSGIKLNDGGIYSSQCDYWQFNWNQGGSSKWFGEFWSELRSKWQKRWQDLQYSLSNTLFIWILWKDYHQDLVIIAWIGWRNILLSSQDLGWTPTALKLTLSEYVKVFSRKTQGHQSSILFECPTYQNCRKFYYQLAFFRRA